MRAENRRFVGPLLSAVSLVLVWSALAVLMESRYLPSPWAVVHIMIQEIASGDLPYHLSVTLGRVAAAFTSAMLIGSAIGLAMGRSRAVNSALDVWLIVLLNIPALVIIILAYIWFGLNESAAIGAVALNKLPNVIVTVREGARALDPDLDQMAKAFRLDWKKRLFEIVIPQLQPYLAAAARSGLSLVWKIVLVVELMGRSNGIGFQLNLFFQLFDVASILAYALSFVFVMLTIEILILQPLEAHANRWRVRTV
ncbi:putative aliphatic sulfonates transport permease protein SsuC [Hartmannibacter diazotrophicus]|uniref:Putative aliphatic sulfonates transport permease protein SsuC n=1 Tax=Hartmannibacter diazotrophicus TaxID=1482074 RepID=A0A2C9D5Z8_9HYPH|nr:ABC transporter permease [Hartmannibacter diazotrophicus]SON55589.1 putative aliphatic sulfonates transport permease protein SsuC [Hartmannibacter diazotrophicus]